MCMEDLMTFRVAWLCKALQFDPQRKLEHGSLFVRVRGTANEKMARISAIGLVTHRCHELHKEQGEKNCHCVAFPMVTRIEWKGEKPDIKERRTLTTTVIGGEGDLLEWYPIGKIEKVKRW